MADSLDHLKKGYRSRFCHGGGNKIDVQPDEKILKFVQDCFEDCSSDLRMNSPNCSAVILKNEKRASLQSPTQLQQPQAASTSSVKRAHIFAETSPASLLKPVGSRGQSHESDLKPATHDYIAASKKAEFPVSENEKNNTLKDVEALCQPPAVRLDSEDNRGSVRSPCPVEEAKSSPVVKLCFDKWNTPAAAKSCGEVENLEGAQPGRDEQIDLVQGTERIPAPSAQLLTSQKEKSFSSAVLAAVTARRLGQRYSTSISPPSPRPVKDQDIEIESECEFSIDESNGASLTSWISKPTKNKKSENDGSAIPISKSQPSADKKTQNKNVKNREVQVKALTKQKQDHLDVGVFYLKEMSEPNPTCSSEENVLTSQSQKSTHMGKTKKDALRQDSPNQKKKAEAEELMLSWSGLETKPPDEEQCKTRMLPSEDLPMPSSGHQEEQTVSLKRSLKSSKNLQLTSEASQHLFKKQTAKQKLPEVQVAERGTVSPRKKLKKSVRKSSNKKPQLEREESSNSESREGELEREPVELNEVCTTPLHQKLETPVIQKLTKREKRRNVLHTAESPGDANNRTPLNALQQPMDNMQKPEKKRSSAKPSGKIPKKRSSAKPSGKIPKKIPRGTNKALCSSPEDTGSPTDSDSSAVQDVPRKKQKLRDVKLKSNKRQHNRRHGPQTSFVARENVSSESGPVLEDSDEFTSCSLSSDACSDTSEDFRHTLKHLLSHGIARHKIVMPSNTPNVRRTKRVRLKPLEYWRGEHVNYTRPSGERTMSGVVHPETKSPRKIERRKDDPKQKREETTSERREIPKNAYLFLSDVSKPVSVVDAVRNVEVYLDCINCANSRTSYMSSDILEVYKTFDTSLFATGKLILKPLKEKGCEFVHMNTMVFHMLRGKVILTLHRAQYYLTAGDCFFVPAGNEYNLRNLLNEASVFFFTHLKHRTKARSTLLNISSP